MMQLIHPSRRWLLLSVISVLVLVAVSGSLNVAAASAHSSHHATHRSPSLPPGLSVDGLALMSGKATYYSACLASSPLPDPIVPPKPSPIPIPNMAPDVEKIQFEIRQGKDTSCVAWGYHQDEIENIGWSYLSIETNPSSSDFIQSRAAGYLEGWLCAERIHQYALTLMPRFYPPAGEPSKAQIRWLNESNVFKESMVRAMHSSDNYWNQIANLYVQLEGMFDGYTRVNKESTKALSWFDLYSLQMEVDIGDITTAIGLFAPDASPEERDRAHKRFAQRHDGYHSFHLDHCSALVKLLPNNADLLVGHDTWSGFNTMLRTFKLYNMPLRCSAGSKAVHMSSYPGFLFSSDDWYQMSDSLLTVTETTNSNYNRESFRMIQPASVDIWARTMVANRMATDGQSWVEYFRRYNSGTCNNQWIIVDHKLFKSGEKDLKPGLLTITEQNMGLMLTADKTQHLQDTTHWSSFNIPYFPENYWLSGQEHCFDKSDAYVCGYEENFRYKLFAELQPKVVDLPSMQNTLLYNDWQHDPLQRNSSRFAIAAREDLDVSNPSAFGGIDTKITSDSWMKDGKLKVSAYSGPTNIDQPPFCWRGQWADKKPLGQPTCFNFPFVDFAMSSSQQEQGNKAQPIAFQ